MSIKTKIQWCDSTVNPTMGCQGCELWRRGTTEVCYAGKLHERRVGHKGFAPTFEEVTKFPGRLRDATAWKDLLKTPRFEKPWLHYLPRLVFVSDMSDCLSDGVSFEYLRDEIIREVSTDAGQRHQWLWLTKRAGRMAQFSDWLQEQGFDWPENLWAGTSVTTQATLTRIDQLLHVGDERTLRFVSVEPQWEYIELGDRLAHLDWVIQGGESGTIDRPFDIDWASRLRDACRIARVPYFLKQLGTNAARGGQRIKFKDKMGGDWSEWPTSLRVRQMPIHVGRKPTDRIRRRKISAAKASYAKAAGS